jgi:dUTP pyrophosphatase
MTGDSFDLNTDQQRSIPEVVDLNFEERLNELELYVKEAISPPEVHLFKIEGGKLPERKSEGAVGYDAYARAIVHPRHRFDEVEHHKRLSLADFTTTPEDSHLRERMVTDPENPDRYGILVQKGEFILVGLGFCTAMPPDIFYWITPRSGLSSRGISLSNAPGTVDSDYRGEAGALLENRGIRNKFTEQGYDEPDGLDQYFTDDGSFILTYNLRICQVLFQKAVHPILAQTSTHEELGQTNRSAGGFGFTGLAG